MTEPTPSRHPVSALIDRVLNDNLLGFLALASLFLALAPTVFDLTPALQRGVDTVELTILAAFALEYFSALIVSRNRRAFMSNPWRMLDALIIVAGLLALMPPVHDLLRNSPVLRLIRFARLALFGTRTGTAIAGGQGTPAPAVTAQQHPLDAFALKGETALEFAPANWEQVLERAQSSQEDWIVVSGLDNEKMPVIAQALAVPEATLRTRFYDAPFPRIERMEKYTTVFLWYPSLPTAGSSTIPVISRCGVLLVGSMHNVVCLTREQTDLPQAITARLPEMDPAMPRLMRTTAAFLKVIVRRYARVADQLEAGLLHIETHQENYRDQQFLDETFRLRAEISRVRGSLKHLTQVLRQLATRPIAIAGFEHGPRAAFSVLADDAESLYDSVDDQLSNLGALVDLRLNISSFQMNKVMRLMAILTALTLIPAVTGGLLGMNLAGNPWPPNLLQVSYGLAFGMTTCLYIFAIKGWLR